MAQNTWVAGRAAMFNTFSSSTGQQVMNVIVNANAGESAVYCAPMNHNIAAIGNQAVTVFADALEDIALNYHVSTGGANDMYWGSQKQGIYVSANLSLGGGNDIAVCDAGGYMVADLGSGDDKALIRIGELTLGKGADQVFIAVDQLQYGQIRTQSIFINDFDPTRVVFNQGQKMLVGSGDTIDLSVFTSLGRGDATVVGNDLVFKLGASFPINIGLPVLPSTSTGGDSGYQMFTPELHIYGVGDMITLMGGIDAAIEMGAITLWGSFGGKG